MITDKTKNYIQKLEKIYHDKYDLSMVEYIGKQENVVIVCKVHGSFKVLACSMQRSTEAEKCPKCQREKTVEETRLALIQRVKNNFDNIDTTDLVYINQKTKVQLECKIHGLFYQYPSNVGRYNCQKCNIQKQVIRQTKTHNKFLKQAKEIHGKRYSYEKAEYLGAHKDLIVICKSHGEFNVSPANHIFRSSGCPSCGKRFSRQEYKIKCELEKYGINYMTQKTYDSLKNPETNKKLFFDFYLPDFDVLIEYDGEHHFQPIRFNGSLTNEEVLEKFEKIKYKDKLKDEFAVAENIVLERITFQDSIPFKIKEIINKYKEIDSNEN